MSIVDDDPRWMAAALALGRRGLGGTWPNPSVGCVIVRGGRVVGRGATAPGGRPHAEVVALAEGGAGAPGATAHVTLEPCAHHGVTPPCADALIAARVARVVVALRDPDPRTNGGGAARLRDVGIEVVDGVMADLAARDHAGFLTRLRLGRPMVTLKLATSLDGRIATGSGESRWITGVGARRLVHAERLAHDAVMVGAGTARADDPMLTVRGLGAVRQPVRVVLSRELDLDPGCALGRTAREAPVWLVHEGAPAHRVAAWEAAGARPIEAPGGAAAALAALGAAGLTRVLCEGGGRLAASLLREGFADRLMVFGAGLAIGADGLASVGPIGLERLGEARRFALEGAEAVGGDVLHRWRAVD